MSLTITPIATIQECRQIEELQIRVWNTAPLDVVPDHLLITVAKNEGIVLLARWDGQPVGFTMAFLAETDDGLRKYASHMAGVLPGRQSKGVGYQLKLAQRQAALDRGVELITWTFDPLVSLNAHFNMGKLGAISNTYFRHLYGDMRAAVSKGLDSDRLEAAWQLDSAHVKAKLAGTQSSVPLDKSLALNPSPSSPSAYPLPSDALRPLSGPRHFIRIPPDIEAIKADDMSLAVAWRNQTRRLFESAFASGYAVTDFVRLAAKNENYYVISPAS